MILRSNDQPNLNLNFVSSRFKQRLFENSGTIRSVHWPMVVRLSTQRSS